MNSYIPPRLKYFVITCLLSLSVATLSALTLSSTAFSATLTTQEEQYLSEAELAQILAPIALYPDTLLTHILIASTYPLEVIAADRWLTNNSSLTTKKIHQKSQKKDWDASIKALLAFPQVMSKLSENLTWMQRLGDAFLQDEGRVMASIQRLRQKAERAGSLKNMDNVQVIKERQVIIIEPAQPEIVYVPYYDTRVVYGRWHWSHYPPVYWHSPYYYTAHHGNFYWGHGVHISTHFFFSAFHWHNRHVVVNHYNRHGYHPRNKIVISHGAKRWNHQPKHRRGVAYSSGRVKQKYHGVRPSIHNGNTNRNKIVRSSHVSNDRKVKKHNKPAVVTNNYKIKPHTKNRKNKSYVAQGNVVQSKTVKQKKHQSSNKHYAMHKPTAKKHATYKHSGSNSSPQKSHKQSTRQKLRQPSKHVVKASTHHKTNKRVN